MSAAESEVAGQSNGAAAPKKAKAEITTVKMEDGTEVEFPGKRKMNKSHTIDEGTGKVSIRLDFRNGMFREISLPESLILKFAAHGAEQKYGDELAGLKGTDGGEPDIDDMVLTIDELDENIQKGLWSTRKEGDGLGGTSVLIKALVEYGGKSVEQVKAFLKDKDAKFKMALRLDEKRPNKAGNTMAYYVKKIEAEKAAKGTKVDTSKALDDLDAMVA
jgi:hypothetical protein